MDRSNKNSSRSAEVYRALMDKNFPEELCREIAYKYMNTDYTATRMLGYLYRMTNPSVEWWLMKCLQFWRIVSVFGRSMRWRKHRRQLRRFTTKACSILHR